MTKFIRAAIAAAAVSALFAAPAMAAQTRTLPDGETLFAIDCSAEVGQLAAVDVLTADFTDLGSGSTSEFVECAGPAAYDPASGDGYWIAWNSPRPYNLFKVDLETGAQTHIGALTSDVPNMTNYFAMIIDPTAGAFVLTQHDNDGLVYLQSLDLATGEATTIETLTIGGADFVDQNSIWSAAFNPVDGKSYFIDTNDDGLYSLDLATGEATLIGIQAEGDSWYGLAFDSAGTMWSTGGEDVRSSTVEGWATAGVQEVSDDSTPWYSESNLIDYKYTMPLAETGTDPSGFALAGFALIAAGAVVLLRRRAKS